ncbi:MAG: glycosyltransferase family 4 protein [Deltaproteobacteria bacterium]|nr:glycosyltransferase family 4 protein [Deltaproteobacteria bacterium]MBW2412884.1 glycosyltransferase family 4 protein [Deltaproteobacteria bacterium]
MKIVFVLTSSEYLSGPQVHLRDLGTALAAQGHQVRIAAGGAGPFRDELDRVGLAYTPLRHMVVPIRPWTDVRGVLEIVSLLRREKPDLVSLHSSKAGVLGRIAARLCGVPVVFTAHGWAFTEAVPGAARYHTAERLVAPLARRIITVCERDRKLALETGVGKESQLVTIHNGMTDVDPLLRADPSVSPPRLVMVSRLVEQKDHATLFRALARLQAAEWELDLAGDGPLRADLERLARDLDIDKRVHFLGARTDVAEILARSQLFLLISRYEGFPRSILEAMRAGLPVIASDVAGVHESVVSGRNGLLAPRGDVEVLSQRIESLLDAPERRAEMGRQGRQLYESDFTFDALFEKTRRVYSQVLGETV